MDKQCMYWYALPGLSLFVTLLYLRRQRITASNAMKLYDAKGKNILITGASSGIGKAATLEFAKCDARVIMACRSRKKAEQTIYDIRKQTNQGHLVIQLVDLSSFDSVNKFVETIKETENRIDVLVNNAGLAMTNYTETEDGHETTFGVNYLSHFLLTLPLLPLLQRSEHCRIINVGSLTYKNAKMNFEDLNLKSNFGAMRAYSQSKLANTLFSNYLKEQLKDSNIIVTTISPGFVNTNLMSDWTKHSKIMKFLKAVVAPVFLRTSSQGCKTVIFASLDPSLEKNCGQFYRDCREQKLLPHALDMSDARKLWEISENLTGIKSVKYLKS